MKKKATKTATRRGKKGTVQDLEPKADPKGGKVHPTDFVFVHKVDKASPVLS
jgi:hypothetical protein